MADHLGELSVPAAFGMEARETPVHPWVMDGVSTVYVAPGTSNLVGGFGTVVKVAGGGLGAVLDSAAALHVALGDGPRVRFDAPTTRQGMVAVLRQWFRQASRAVPGGTFALGAPAAAVEGLADLRWTRTPDLDAVLAGRRTVRFSAHTPEDVLTALRVAEEFGLRAVIEGASGAHVVARRVAEAGAAVVLGPAIGGAGGGGSPETFAHTAASAGVLHAAGVPVAISTDGSGGRAVTVEAIVARGHGLPAEQTLRALTLDAARILGVDGRVGSLEPGKDADLVLWAGDPVGTWGQARVVVVEGRVVFRRDG
jgi:imidazolonepropionase-like amidohydrolase